MSSRKQNRLIAQKVRKEENKFLLFTTVILLVVGAMFLFTVLMVPYGIYVMIVRNIIEGLAYMSFGGFWSIMIFDMFKRWFL